MYYTSIGIQRVVCLWELWYFIMNVFNGVSQLQQTVQSLLTKPWEICLCFSSWLVFFIFFCHLFLLVYCCFTIILSIPDRFWFLVFTVIMHNYVCEFFHSDIQFYGSMGEHSSISVLLIADSIKCIRERKPTWKF